MNDENFYAGVTGRSYERLLEFRAKHELLQHVRYNGRDWPYYAGGEGKEALVFLVGGFGTGEPTDLMLDFEDNIRVISAFYPPGIDDPDEVLTGIAAILDAEGITDVHVAGSSLGGVLAQLFVRRYPERTRSAILINTHAPRRRNAVQMKAFAKLVTCLPSRFASTWLDRIVDRYLTKDAEDEEEARFTKAFMREVFSKAGPNELARVARLTANCNLVEMTPHDLDGWPGRIQILESDTDAGSDKVRMRLRALYPTARDEMFHGAGHAIPKCARERFNQVVLEVIAATRAQQVGALPRSASGRGR